MKNGKSFERVILEPKLQAIAASWTPAERRKAAERMLKRAAYHERKMKTLRRQAHQLSVTSRVIENRLESRYRRALRSPRRRPLSLN